MFKRKGAGGLFFGRKRKRNVRKVGYHAPCSVCVIDAGSRLIVNAARCSTRRLTGCEPSQRAMLDSVRDWVRWQALT